MIKNISPLKILFNIKFEQNSAYEYANLVTFIKLQREKVEMFFNVKSIPPARRILAKFLYAKRTTY